MNIDLQTLLASGEQQIIQWLKMADDLYENDTDASDAIDDATYDKVRKYAHAMYPANEYFIGVGSDVRGSKVKLAYPMNGLEQRYTEDLQQWLNTVNGNKVTSEKLDGVSAQLVYNKGQLQISFSRGNGVEAADTTRHVRNIKSVPATLNCENVVLDGKLISDITLPIRAEIIISRENWPKLRDIYTKRDGVKYANARAMIASIMNSSTVPDYVYEYIDCVAYTIIDCAESKVTQFEILSLLGFKVPKYEVHDASQTTDFYTTLTSFWRHESKYELDGIVINAGDVNAVTNCINAGAPAVIKYKVMESANQAIATVKQVVYSVSKDGYVIPRVNIFPTQLAGVTINYATGYNGQFIRDNGIGPGAKIRITRAGDVVPDIIGVEYSVTPQLPDPEEVGEWVWTSTGVHIVLVDRDSNPDALLNRLTDSLTKLKIAHAKEGNVKVLIEQGYDTIEKILLMDYVDLYQTLGENGKKIYESKQDRLSSIYWPEFVGALNILGRGIGIRKITALYNHFSGDIDSMRSLDSVLSVPGFELTTAKPIVENLQNALDLIDRLTNEGVLNCTTYSAAPAPTGTKFAGKGVVFTGVRDAQLESQIIAEGGIIKSSISSSVHMLVCKDSSTASGKAKKARELGIEIIDVLELRRRLV